MYINDRAQFYGSLVWIIAALAMFVYIVYVLLGYKTSGVEQLIAFLLSIESVYIAVAGFVSMFFEGLYFIGGFFPGASLVVLVAVFSQSSGVFAFIATIFCVFLGWVAAGGVNIVLAKWYIHRKLHEPVLRTTKVKDYILTTWYPAFRANYEVAQILEGADPKAVFYFSVRVKLYVSILIGLAALAVPFFIDVREVSNEEGFMTLVLVAVITFVVGIVKLKKAVVWR